MRNIFSKLVFLFVITYIFSSCTNSVKTNSEEKHTVTLLVTKDFGSEKLFNKQIEINGQYTVLDALKDNTDVEIIMGGFVKSINGISSSSKNGEFRDWFYYVNGTAGNDSANSYFLKDKDKILWDYNIWAGEGSISAIIGSYPEPFINGYNGKTTEALIYYCDSSKKSAKKLEESLKKLGSKKVFIKNLSDSIEKKEGQPSIIIGTWEKIRDNKEVQEIFSRGKNGGIFAKVEDVGIEIANFEGKLKSKTKKDSGIIISTASMLGDTSPVWIITAFNSEKIDEIVDMMVKNPKAIENNYGVVFQDNSFTNIPLD